ncbi:MAG: hypothetical protein M1819_006893 [Sarea resinae]|nr:MAG: hypothetical protein M1819_006893 [Sarea resinae]
MPGRVSTRSTRTSVSTTSRASVVSRKSSTQNPSSRTLATSRTSATPAELPDEGPTSSLRTQTCVIFADSQRTTATHRKLVVSLRKIQETCCYEPVKPRKSTEEDFGEEEFNAEVARCVIRIMGVKKTEAVGDRVVRFVGLFLRHASEKDNELVPDSESDETEAFPETPSTRLTTQILSLLLPLMTAKEKTIRYRATQLVSHIINSLDSVDDELFQHLRLGLLKRIRDKESMVRVQAVLGLGRLAGNEAEDDQENGDSDDDDSGGLLERLMDVLQNDPSAEVRRSLLLNLPLTQKTLPYLLERARDLDPGTRRALYSRLLPALGDFRHLSLSMREKLLRWGLRDRDQTVRRAAAKVFRERWIEDCAGTRTVTEGGVVVEEKHPPSFEGLQELLERIDVVNSGLEDGVALEAMKEFWDGRPDYRDAVTFDDAFWTNLSAESVFMARTFNDFCRAGEDGKYDALIEEKMPEVTKLAFFLQHYTNTLIEKLRNAAQQPDAEEDETIELEFIVEQLLHIALTLDYSDEVGRRKTFSLMRETLAIAELPEETTKQVVEVLRAVCGNERAGEREFCGVVLEAVAEVHDTILGDEEAQEDDSFHSARSELSDDTPTKMRKARKQSAPPDDSAVEEEQAIREIMVNMKCLHIAQCMLQNVDGDLQENVHLVTMLNNLVVPAVRSHEAPIRERGLLCLGLCCLLDKNLAQENLSLFLHCFNKGHDALQITALQIISDILTKHPILLSSPLQQESTSESAPNPLLKPIHKTFAKALKSASPEVQSAGTTSLSKLMLLSILKDEDLLKSMVIAYFEPETADNAALRQALSYFLPVYCHSRRENMERMGRVAVGVMEKLVGINEDLMDEDDGNSMVGLGVVAAHLADWTDARKLVVLDQEGAGGVGMLGLELDGTSGRAKASVVDSNVHLDLAVDILERALGSGCPKELKKPLLSSMLPKLHLSSPTSDTARLRVVADLATEAVDARIAADATGRNALGRIVTAVSKVLGDASVEESGERDGDGDGEVEVEETVVVGGVEGSEDVDGRVNAGKGEKRASDEDEGEEEEEGVGAEREGGDTGAIDDDDNDEEEEGEGEGETEEPQTETTIVSSSEKPRTSRRTRAPARSSRDSLVDELLSSSSSDDDDNDDDDDEMIE